MGKAFARGRGGFVPIPMPSLPSNDVYSPREVAQAAGVPEVQVLAALGGVEDFIRFDDAVRLGRSLVAGKRGDGSKGSPSPALRTRLFGAAVSSTLHAGGVGALIFITTFGLAPAAETLKLDERPSEPMRLVFLATPGPGGGGGGGGLQQKPPPPKALREGRHSISSPMPRRDPPKPVVAIVTPPEPKPAPLDAEPLPAVVAPIITAPADTRNRVGVLEQASAETDSHGSGKGGGVGTGTGTGLGEGDGSGVGPGSGGGTGGGPYRPGSGVTPPRLLREVKADYTEEARQRGLSGEVVLEIVVRRDGLVGDVKILKGLGSGLNERSVQAVRQWRFAPAQRHGTPVDVIVEVAVEFKLR